MQKSMILYIWNRIVSELALQQDKSPKGLAGQIVNPICGRTYTLDTACAIKVFTVEYLRTQDEEWRNRARFAFESIKIDELFSGLHEPIWNVLGWHDVPGSLAATGMAIDALWDSIDLLNVDLSGKDHEQLLTFLDGCFYGKGRFAHNTVKSRERPGDVQNTTAVALYLLEYIAKKRPKLKHDLLKERSAAIRHLCKGQRNNGFWPYIYPGWKGNFTYLKKIRGIKKFFVFADSNDTLHHVMTLYFVTKYFLLSRRKKNIEIIARGWKWIKRHLININGDRLAIDWSWEPMSKHPRYCNYRDTNTYFWILGLLPYLGKLEIIKRDESVEISNSIIEYIHHNLLEDDGKIPCIVPHEGPPEILRNILPMFDQGVAWKGNHLAEVIRQRFLKRATEDDRIG